MKGPEADWKNIVLTDDDFMMDNGIYRHGIDKETLAYRFHEEMPSGAILRELEKKEFHLSYWESRYYRDAVREFAQDSVSENAIAIDVGCGDGRLTFELLRMGFDRVIATDIDIRPLMALRKELERTGELDKVLLLQCDVTRIPVQTESCDVAICIGVLYYLNERYEDGLREIHRVLRRGGILVNSEPDLEGALYKSIFFEELSDVLENYFDRRFKEQKGDTDYKFKLFSRDEMRKQLASVGLSVSDSHGLSLFSSILRIKTVRGAVSEERLKEEEPRLREVLNYLDEKGQLHKHVIWKSIKK